MPTLSAAFAVKSLLSFLSFSSVIHFSQAFDDDKFMCHADSLTQVVNDGGLLRFQTKISAIDNAFSNAYMQIFIDKIVPCSGYLATWHFKPTAPRINGLHLLVLRHVPAAEQPTDANNNNNSSSSSSGGGGGGGSYRVVLDTAVDGLQLPTDLPHDSWIQLHNSNIDPSTFVQIGDVLGVAYDFQKPTSTGGVLVRSKIVNSNDVEEYEKQRHAMFQRTAPNMYIVDVANTPNTLVVNINGNFVDLKPTSSDRRHQNSIVIPTDSYDTYFEWRQAFLDADITTPPQPTTTTSSTAAPAAVTVEQAVVETTTPTTTSTSTTTTEMSLQQRSEMLAQRCSSMTSQADVQCGGGVQQQRRYRYDFDSGSCQAFDGCPATSDSARSLGTPGANGDGGNNFGSWSECVRGCSVFRCGQYPISATNVYPCREQRWYYNVAIERCQEFTGCDAGPERNNFASEDECMQFCTAYPFVSNWRPSIESRSKSASSSSSSQLRRSSSSASFVRHQ